MGEVSKETVSLFRLGVLQDNLSVRLLDLACEKINQR